MPALPLTQSVCSSLILYEITFCSFRITHQPCSALLRSVQAVDPCWWTPSSRPWYVIFFPSVRLSSVCLWATAAFLQYWKLWIDLNVNHVCLSRSWHVWHAARGRLRLPFQRAFVAGGFFLSLQHDMTAGLCVCAVSRRPPGWPPFAARQCVMTLGVSWSERAVCWHLLSAFSTTLIFSHTLFGLIGSRPNITHRALPVSVSTSQTFSLHQVALEGWGGGGYLYIHASHSPLITIVVKHVHLCSEHWGLTRDFHGIYHRSAPQRLLLVSFCCCC